MVLSKIIGSITKSFFEQSKINTLYFSVPEKILNYTCSCFSEKGIIIDLSKELSPLKPYLTILKRYNPSTRDIGEYAYTMHRGTFSSYFATGIVERRLDLLIKEEIFYEKIKIRETIVALIKKYANENFYILNAQLLSDDTVKILQDLENSNLKCKFIYIFKTNSVDENSDLNSFYQNILTSKNFFEITDFDDTVIPDTKINIPKKPNYKQINTFLINCRHFLAFSQALEFLEQLKNDESNYHFTKKQQRNIYLQIGIIAYRYEKYDIAMIYLNKVLEDGIEDEVEISALFCKCQLNYEIISNEQAQKCANLILKKLKNNQENPFYALATMMDYIITQKHNILQSVENYERTLKLLYKNCLINNYLYTHIIVPWQTLNDSDTPYNTMPKIDEAIELAEKIGNRYVLSKAYNWKGILLLHNGKTGEAHQWYEKCDKIRTEINDLYSIMMVRNGIAYENLITGNFEKSFNIINSFIGRITEITDNAEIIITLTNIANTYFYSRQFYDAMVLYQKILHLLTLFEKKKHTINQFLPEYNDILSYKTLIDLSFGYISRARINYHNIINNGKASATINSPIRYLIKAILQLEDKKLDEACQTIKDCDQIFERFSSAQNYKKIFIYYEFAKALSDTGYNEKAAFYFQTGFDLAKKYNLTDYIQGKTNLTLEEYFSNIKTFKPLEIKLSSIDEKAEKEKLMDQMQKRLNDSQFINKIMSSDSDTQTNKNFAQKIILDLQEYILADSIFLAEKNNNQWNTIAAITKTEIEIPSKETWTSLEKQSKTKKLSERLTYIEDYNFYYANISKYNFKGAIIIITDSNSIISNDELNVVNIAISSIQAQLIMKTQNNNLLQISSTDQLSMLKNRRALKERLSLEGEVIRRYLKNKDKHFEHSIAFIDLDNFKFINDTFGHEAGDMIIANFAKLLKKIYRKVDFVSRFGGDEFVILLPNTSSENAKKAADRLWKELEKENYFITSLEKMLNKKIEIKENQRLGFSMGIASNFDIEDKSDMEKTLSNADEALYYSKEHGKNQVTLWSSIKK